LVFLKEGAQGYSIQTHTFSHTHKHTLAHILTHSIRFWTDESLKRDLIDLEEVCVENSVCFRRREMRFKREENLPASGGQDEPARAKSPHRFHFSRNTSGMCLTHLLHLFYHMKLYLKNMFNYIN